MRFLFSRLSTEKALTMSRNFQIENIEPICSLYNKMNIKYIQITNTKINKKNPKEPYYTENFSLFLQVSIN